MLAMEMKAAGMYVSRGLSFREAEVKEIFCYCQFSIICNFMYCLLLCDYISFICTSPTLHCVLSYLNIVRY